MAESSLLLKSLAAGLEVAVLDSELEEELEAESEFEPLLPESAEPVSVEPVDVEPVDSVFWVGAPQAVKPKTRKNIEAVMTVFFIRILVLLA